MGWSGYTALLWTLKASLLVFYLRLTAGLSRGYRIRIYIGFGILLATFMVVLLNLYLGCRPLYKYWQISPDPGSMGRPSKRVPRADANATASYRRLLRSDIPSGRLGQPRLQRPHGPVPPVHPATHAVELDAEASEEGRLDDRLQRGPARHHVRRCTLRGHCDGKPADDSHLTPKPRVA